MSGPYIYTRTPGTYAPPPPPPSGSPNKGGPSTPNRSIPRRRRRTCGRCRVEAREDCSGTSPCQWCTRTGDRCAYGPSPDAQSRSPPAPAPAAAPTPPPAPTSSQNPAWWTPGGTHRQPSGNHISPLSISSDGSQPRSANSPAQNRPGTPRQPSGQSNPGTPSNDPRARGSPLQQRPHPRASPTNAPNQAPNQGGSKPPSYPQDQALVRAMNQPPPSAPGGAPYAPQPPVGTSFRGDEPQLAQMQAAAQSENPNFDDAWEASEHSRRAEEANRERRGEGKW